ncbi:zinc finger C2H2-type/integrase DNA-binding domain-containing protein [Artemisia annua]|uniref:Zinc finger C2H2-type/integrase DNA-binding domain-containing protein n=1 Tax=Artemisia annua TaxID=35608 RepID=A0A2U1KIR9_ARTAN|nr:zinc finger C2H2-type/integrase DNA-binding domain-containing protein [Artemisia annua]
MESHACINHNAAVLSPTPTRKILIRLKTPMSTIILNGDKAIEKSSVSKVEKTHAKRVFDVIHANDFEPESVQAFKKTKRQTDIWNHVNVVAANNKAPAALVKPTATRFKEVQKTGQQHMDKRKDLLQRFVNDEGKPTCPICQENFVSIKFLYQHMALKSDKDWKTFIASLNTHNIDKSGENQIHDDMVVDLSKCLPGWDMKTGKRGRLGSRVADVMVNKGPNTKEYLGLIAVDHVEMNEEDIQAAKTLVLIARDYLSNARKSMVRQREVEAAMVESSVQVKEFRDTNMTERQRHVKDSADRTNGEFKAVLDIDLNEPYALEDDGSVTMT